jgi:hypothetical protein
VTVARPASWYEEIDLEDEAPAVLPEETAAAVPVAAQPERRLVDQVWLVLALLGLGVAAAATVWYVRLRPAAPRMLVVPHVVGLGEVGAVHALTTEGFRVRAVEEASSGRTVVTSQRPRADARLAHGATVTIHVARRPDRSIASRS